jgi:nucleoside-diphosphate-sugar epimerase
MGVAITSKQPNNDPLPPVALVVGATGYTGREVVRLLAEQGIQTIAHIRPDSPMRDTWQERFTKQGARCDFTPWEAEHFEQTIQTVQPTHVFSLLGTTRKRTQRERKEGARFTGYDGVDYGLSVLLLNACDALSTPPRFLYLSSLGVRASTGNAYLDARWRVEEKVRGSEIPYTIVRPCFITGKDRDENRTLERVGSILSDGALSVLGKFGAKGLQRKFQSITGTELAAALIHLSFDSAATNQTIESGHLPMPPAL